MSTCYKSGMAKHTELPRIIFRSSRACDPVEGRASLASHPFAKRCFDPPALLLTVRPIP